MCVFIWYFVHEAALNLSTQLFVQVKLPGCTLWRVCVCERDSLVLFQSKHTQTSYSLLVDYMAYKIIHCLCSNKIQFWMSSRVSYENKQPWCVIEFVVTFTNSTGIILRDPADIRTDLFQVS